jgi:ArsR family transcriptional regulator
MSNGKTKRLLGDDDLEGIARHFKLLGEPMRLKILQTVCRAPLTVNDIVAATGSTQANVSKHLALLAAGGVLTRKKERQCVYYGMKSRLVMKLCELVHSQPAG